LPVAISALSVYSFYIGYILKEDVVFEDFGEGLIKVTHHGRRFKKGIPSLRGLLLLETVIAIRSK